MTILLSLLVWQRCFTCQPAVRYAGYRSAGTKSRRFFPWAPITIGNWTTHSRLCATASLRWRLLVRQNNGGRCSNNSPMKGHAPSWPSKAVGVTYGSFYPKLEFSMVGRRSSASLHRRHATMNATAGIPPKVVLFSGPANRARRSAPRKVPCDFDIFDIEVIPRAWQLYQKRLYADLGRLRKLYRDRTIGTV